MSKTKVKVKSKPGMFMKHDIAINAMKAQKQSESEFKGRNAKEKSESASTTWKVHEQDELAARPCWRLWTVPDLQKTFDHSDDYVKILQSAQRCKSYGGRNILKPKWKKKLMRKPAGDGGEGEAAIRDARDSFSRTELAGFQIHEVNLHLSGWMLV